MNIKQLQPPAELEAGIEANGGKLVGLYLANACLQVMIGLEPQEEGGPQLLHMSVAHPRRYPTWDEIKAIRYGLLPNEKTFGILFPPMEEYVNVHPNCFHLYEIPPAVPVKAERRILLPGEF